MAKVLKTWFKNLQIKNKIIAIYIPLIIVPLCIISYIFNSIFSENIINKTIKNVSGNSKLIISQIEVTLNNAENCANMLTINLNKILLENTNPNYRDYSMLNNSIAGAISNTLVIFPDVDSAAFIDHEYNLYTNNAKLSDYRKQPNYPNITNRLAFTNGINIFFPMEKRSFLVTDETTPVLTIGKKVFDVSSGESFGNIIVNIREHTFSKIFKSLRNSSNSTYFITDENNTIISSSDSYELLTNIKDKTLLSLLAQGNSFSKIMKYKGENMLITCENFNKMPWKLLTVTPIAELTQDVNNMTKVIVSITFICFFIALVGASALSYVIAKPIIILKKAMSKIENEILDVECTIDSQDEIGSLSRGFNSMIKRVKELIDRVNFEQKRKREFELALINSQIKPHFLYNTLDVIYVLCDMERYEDVKLTTKALADFYRVALSKGNDIITLEEEFKSVKEYLFIQNIRYSDVFNYHISIEDSILKYSICKLTIQPIVENAIYHGLKQKRGMGNLSIFAYSYKEDLIIKIKDDGKGMSPERINQVLMLGKHKNNSSFGLYSVNERIKLYFGESYGITINSVINEGTEVIITIPKTTLGDDKDASISYN